MKELETSALNSLSALLRQLYWGINQLNTRKLTESTKSAKHRLEMQLIERPPIGRNQCSNAGVLDCWSLSVRTVNKLIVKTGFTSMHYRSLQRPSIKQTLLHGTGRWVRTFLGCAATEGEI